MTENIRLPAPYDNPAFESLCREYDIWGPASTTLCAVFWRAGQYALAGPADAGGVVEPVRPPAGYRRLTDADIARITDGMGSYAGEYETALARAVEQHLTGASA